jgi:SAM-dependent methyltransferase
MSAASIRRFIKKKLPKPLLEALLLIVYAKDRLPEADIYVRHVAGKRGLEVGGPSLLFKTVLPLYQAIGALDGANFLNETIWEGRITEGHYFNFIWNRKGLQLVAEATQLTNIADGSYDFILSSNCLEHVANPLKALHEWRRVIRPGGALVLVLPKKDSNFDHRRPVTRFEHLLEDFRNDTTEHDMTHLDEIIALHDLSRDPAAGDIEAFRARSLENFHNRTLHHHVFDVPLMQAMLKHADFDVIQANQTRTDYFALAIKKP